MANNNSKGIVEREQARLEVEKGLQDVRLERMKLQAELDEQEAVLLEARAKKRAALNKLKAVGGNAPSSSGDWGKYLTKRNIMIGVFAIAILWALIKTIAG